MLESGGGAQVTNVVTTSFLCNTDQHPIAFRLANPWIKEWQSMAIPHAQTTVSCNPNLNRINDIGINEQDVMLNGPIQTTLLLPICPF